MDPTCLASNSAWGFLWKGFLPGESATKTQNERQQIIDWQAVGSWAVSLWLPGAKGCPSRAGGKAARADIHSPCQCGTGPFPPIME